MSARTGRRALAPVLPMLGRQTWALVLNYLRVPAFSVTSLALPLMFFTFFGIPNAGRTMANGANAGAYLLCSFGAYAVSSVMVFNFGIGVATQRAQKQDLLQRATPLPGWVSIAAQVLNGLLFGLAALVLLFAYAFVTAGVHLDALVTADLLLRLMLGALPLLALGMAIGYSVGPGAAPAVTNLIYLPMAFASGFFVPVDQLPEFIQKLAKFMPTYYYGQLAWDTIGAGSAALATSLAWLLGWSLVLFLLAIRAYRLEASRKFA